MTIGAFYQCWKHPAATIQVIRQFRTFYPDATIYLVSDNGYDYYYFRKEIIKGFTVTADYNTNNNLVVFSIEPNFVIKDIQTLKELINVFSKIQNAKREVNLSKENG